MMQRGEKGKVFWNANPPPAFPAGLPAMIPTYDDSVPPAQVKGPPYPGILVTTTPLIVSPTLFANSLPSSIIVF